MMNAGSVGLLAALVTVLAWGCAVIPIRMARAPGALGLAYSLPAGLALCVLPAWLAGTVTLGDASVLFTRAGLYVALGGLCQFPLATLCYYEALRQDEISTVVPLKCLKSIVVALIVAVGGWEPITRQTVAAGLLGVAGAFILTARGGGARGAAPAGRGRAFMLILLACVFWSLGDVLIGRALVTLPPPLVTPLALAMGALAYYGWMIAAGKTAGVAGLSRHDKLCYAAHGIVSFGIGYWAFFLAMKSLGILKAVIATSAWPLVSFAVGLLLYKETVDGRKLLGAGLLLLSVYGILCQR